MLPTISLPNEKQCDHSESTQFQDLFSIFEDEKAPLFSKKFFYNGPVASRTDRFRKRTPRAWVVLYVLEFGKTSEAVHTQRELENIVLQEAYTYTFQKNSVTQ